MSLKKRSAKELWRRTSHRVQEINHWKNSESSTNVFTARASFRILDEHNEPFIRGECINIDKSETIVKSCCEKYHYDINKFLHIFTHEYLKYSLHLINLIGCGLGILILHDFIPNIYGLAFGLFWLFIPLTIILIANKYVMWRIWRKSMIPWIQLYISLLETWSFCDICNWDYRICVIGPPMILNQLTIINLDAVYFKARFKYLINIHIVISLFWKFYVLYGIRFGLFPNLRPRDLFVLAIDPNSFSLNNVSLFVSKATSMIIFLFGQIYFKCRHPEQAYALRTHYTVKLNSEWNRLNRNNRIHKKRVLRKSVRNTREHLQIIV